MRSVVSSRTDILNTQMTSIVDTLVEILLASGCEGPRSHIGDKLTKKFGHRLSVIATLAIGLNKAIGEDSMSYGMTAISMPHGVEFIPRIMEDAYEETQEQSTSQPSRVLCTAELGLQRDDKDSTNGQGRGSTLVILKPKVALESLTDNMQQRDVSHPCLSIYFCRTF